MNFTIHFMANIYLEKAEAFTLKFLSPQRNESVLKNIWQKKEKKNQSKTLSVPILLSSRGFT